MLLLMLKWVPIRLNQIKLWPLLMKLKLKVLFRMPMMVRTMLSQKQSAVALRPRPPRELSFLATCAQVRMLQRSLDETRRELADLKVLGRTSAPLAAGGVNEAVVVKRGGCASYFLR